VAKSPLRADRHLHRRQRSSARRRGQREAYRICLALADLRSGKLVSKGLAFALPDGVDPTPLAFFRDAPAWSDDPATEGYIKTCQGTKAGDPINPLYLDRIVAARASRRSHRRLRMPGATRRRSTSTTAPWRRRRATSSASSTASTSPTGSSAARPQAAGGLRKGSSITASSTSASRRQIPVPAGVDRIRSGSETERPLPGLAEDHRRQAASGGSKACLEVTGHTSPTGPEPLNERLSLLRAEVRQSRDKLEGATRRRSPNGLIANGVGSRQTMVGNGRDDASDALDRRVEFKVIGC
jgi:outer membrane protein OmpA-like peptidoglycan-associated protein